MLDGRSIPFIAASSSEFTPAVAARCLRCSSSARACCQKPQPHAVRGGQLPFTRPACRLLRQCPMPNAHAPGDCAQQSPAEQSRAEQSRAEQSRAEQRRTRTRCALSVSQSARWRVSWRQATDLKPPAQRHQSSIRFDSISGCPIERFALVLFDTSPKPTFLARSTTSMRFRHLHSTAAKPPAVGIKKPSPMAPIASAPSERPRRCPDGRAVDETAHGSGATAARKARLEYCSGIGASPPVGTAAAAPMDATALKKAARNGR
jgi:hypothetical protein